MSNKSQGIHVKIPDNLLWEAKERAKQKGISLNKLLVDALEEHVLRLRVRANPIKVVPYKELKHKGNKGEMKSVE